MSVLIAGVALGRCRPFCREVCASVHNLQEGENFKAKTVELRLTKPKQMLLYNFHFFTLFLVSFRVAVFCVTCVRASDDLTCTAHNLCELPSFKKTGEGIQLVITNKI